MLASSQKVKFLSFSTEKTHCYRRCARETAILKYRTLLNVARSFVHKVRRELEASDDNVESVAKRRKHKPRSDTVRTPQIMQEVQGIINEDSSKSIRAISSSLQVPECTIRRIVHEDTRYKSYLMSRG